MRRRLCWPVPDADEKHPDLHGKNVLLLDLKSSNIFFTSNKFVKMGDYGISKVLLDCTSAKNFVGTPYYLSPEVCSNKKDDLRSDLCP